MKIYLFLVTLLLITTGYSQVTERTFKQEEKLVKILFNPYENTAEILSVDGRVSIAKINVSETRFDVYKDALVTLYYSKDNKIISFCKYYVAYDDFLVARVFVKPN